MPKRQTAWYLAIAAVPIVVVVAVGVLALVIAGSTSDLGPTQAETISILAEQVLRGNLEHYDPEALANVLKRLGASDPDYSPSDLLGIAQEAGHLYADMRDHILTMASLCDPNTPREQRRGYGFGENKVYFIAPERDAFVWTVTKTIMGASPVVEFALNHRQTNSDLDNELKELCRDLGNEITEINAILNQESGRNVPAFVFEEQLREAEPHLQHIVYIRERFGNNRKSL